MWHANDVTVAREAASPSVVFVLFCFTNRAVVVFVCLLIFAGLFARACRYFGR